MWVKKVNNFWRFCHLNIPCLRIINITLILMNFSSDVFTLLYENSKTDVYWFLATISVPLNGTLLNMTSPYKAL